MFEFLQADDRNIVVVHCNAGKGRTGTSIASFLIYCGLANNATEAINYYGWKRFSTGKGVSQPWQLRYIHYFEAVYKRKVLWSLPKILECLIITTVPKINQNGWKPYMDILNGDYKCIYTTKNSINLKKYKAGPKETEEYNVIKIYPEKKNLVLSGDVHFMIKHKGSFNNTSIWRFSINTGFCGNEVEISRQQVSPDSVAVSKKFHDKFKITVVLRDYWDVCTNAGGKTLLSSELWERWQLRMAKASKEWDAIYDIIKAHEPYPSREIGEKLCFYDEVDYYEVVNKKLVVQWEQYNLIKAQGDDNNESHSDDEQAKEEDIEEFKHDLATSKEDRNTMVSNRNTLENKTEEEQNYFRSVNEFPSETRKVSFEAEKLQEERSKFTKMDSDKRIVEIDELSSSSDTNKSGGSELGFRERRKKSNRFIEKAAQNVSRKTDPNERHRNTLMPSIHGLNKIEDDDMLEVVMKPKRSSSVYKL